MRARAAGERFARPPGRGVPDGNPDRSTRLAAPRTVTRAAHVRLETSSTMKRLLCDDCTVGEYVGPLCALLGFYEPFETTLAGIGTLQTPPRSCLLAEDLRSLGLTNDEIRALPRCEAFPSIAGPGSLGVLYVYRGSTVGGQIIARHLRRSLGATRRFAFSCRCCAHARALDRVLHAA